MKRCTRCVLPETFPGIDFDDKGICSYCRTFRGAEKLEASKKKYRSKFEKLLKAYSRRGNYDCIMAYSGGKDSTYTLVVLKEKYDMSILALTVDNGFISPAAIKNMHNVVEGLGIDHITYKPRFDIMKKIFKAAESSDMYPRKTLERASTICTSCMGIIKFIALRMAVESDIPFIGYGWSPGQAPIEASIFKNNPSMIKKMQNVLLEPMEEAAGLEVHNYYLTEEHLNRKKSFPYNISPLAFLDYDEGEILEKIDKLGWMRPSDTDPNSTNCLLNSYANMIHLDRFQFHPYAFELAKLVREGYLDRGEAMKRLETPEKDEIVHMVKKRLE